MLPDFTKVKKQLWDKVLTPTFEHSKNSDSFLSRIRHTIQHEGEKMQYETVSGETIRTEYQKFSAEYGVTIAEVEAGDFSAIVKKFEKLGDEAATQLTRYSFKFVSQVVDKVGNSIATEGKFTPDVFIQMVEKIEIDFDEYTGEPSMPTMYIHPDMAQQVRDLISEADSNPEYKVKFDQIIERKREEWRARENCRKLVE